MKPDVFYCHACLDEMGMQRNGSRSRPKVLHSVEDECPCCKKDRTLFNMRDYQMKPESFCRKYQQRLEAKKPLIEGKSSAPCKSPGYTALL